MSRNRTVLASAIAAIGLGATPVILAAAPAAATAQGTAQVRPQAHPAAAAATISLRKTGRGMLLVNSRGFTVYAFSKDAKRQNRCAAISGCTTIWPMVKSGGRPQAGKGVKRSLLGTIKVGSATQVTYAGHPLYGFAGDKQPGEANGDGQSAFGGTWTALKGSGAPAK